MRCFVCLFVRVFTCFRDLIDDSSSPTWINTMPVGNGRYAANVWVDKTAGTINALIASGGAWSEAGELLKVFCCLSGLPPLDIMCLVHE